MYEQNKSVTVLITVLTRRQNSWIKVEYKVLKK